ncbi:sensor histidine kinase [Novacetimonas hansenii]
MNTMFRRSAPRNGEGRSYRTLLRIGRMFDAVRVRMMAIILFAAMPIALIGAVQAWRNYHKTLAAPGYRTDMTLERVNLEIRHEVDDLGSMLRVVGHMALDDEGIRRMLELAQSLTGHHYDQIALVDALGNIVTQVGRTEGAHRLVLDDMPRFQGDVRVSYINGGAESHNLPIAFRVTVATMIGDGSGHLARSGFLTAIMPLSWADRKLRPGDPRLDIVVRDNPVAIWVLNPDGSAAAPLCGDCDWPLMPSAMLLGRVQRIMRNGHDHARGTLPDGAFSLGRVEGGVFVLAATRRNAKERHAVLMFAIALVSSGLLLLTGLLGASKSADVLIVSPLRKLTASVNLWQLGGVYDVRSNWAMPFEVRQLAHAFSKATRRLARHERRLERAAVRQELLLKEMHHRVKNNLQIVASLLNLQAGRITQPAAREEFAQARDRVRALATLHRYLYAEGGLYNLNMQSFVRQLCGQIMHAIGEADDGRITLDIQVEDLLMVPDQAVPLALIVTEAVSNTIKYAFPDGARGTLEVGLRQVDKMRACLWIADDGVGMAAGRVRRGNEERSGIGLQLIRGFARQLGGELQMFEENGTRYVLVFVLQQPEPDQDDI